MMFGGWIIVSHDYVRINTGQSWCIYCNSLSRKERLLISPRAEPHFNEEQGDSEEHVDPEHPAAVGDDSHDSEAARDTSKEAHTTECQKEPVQGVGFGDPQYSWKGMGRPFRSPTEGASARRMLSRV